MLILRITNQLPIITLEFNYQPQSTANYLNLKPSAIIPIFVLEFNDQQLSSLNLRIKQSWAHFKETNLSAKNLTLRPNWLVFLNYQL